MSLTPRLVAIQGIGFSAIELAVQGLLYIETVPVAPGFLFRPGTAGMGGGPDANLSLADYLKKFGRPTTTPFAAPTAAPVHTPAQRLALARKKRQRMEDETLALAAPVFE